MVRRADEVHVVVVGSTNFDMVVKGDRLPKEGESMIAREPGLSVSRVSRPMARAERAKDKA